MRRYWPWPKDIDFTTNDYLGFIRQGILEELAQKLPPLPWGSGGSLYLGGLHPVHEELTTYLCKFLGYATALLFPSGFQANLALLSSLPQKGDTILYDQAIHASLREGMRLSYAYSRLFPHNDFEKLEKHLRTAKGRVFVVLEGLYSMEGDGPDAQALQFLRQHYEFTLILDEAHSHGILGVEGRGWHAQEGIMPDVLVITFGKTLGLQGAALLTHAPLHTLQQSARPHIYSTALSPKITGLLLKAYEYLRKADSLRNKLWENVRFLRKCAQDASLDLRGGGPIFWLPAVPSIEPPFLKRILPPSAPTPRWRISLHAFNTHQEITYLINSLREETFLCP
ncbi:MAG: aminotransferase class I/II-fold pyridoxal phosphate-dependent enzyme [Bacteroidia bacterium]